ncbi:phenylalanine--tRNA ligase subunit beta [Candidatus Micrarchaeota archaeon CG08_land_8_20_14_0_20_59_11]|nr:MAG: phenylalanine--tRNA ligase subunit beta [Candidatus Micrarchaeota archaeon CG08_land_8_20_14_0_20_59_11]
MVSVSVSKSWLLSRLRGIAEAQLLEKLPDVKATVEADKGDALTLEITPDRPDLLCREGILRSLKGLFEKETGLPLLNVAKGKAAMKVDASVKAVRPFICCAFARGLKINGDGIAEIMQVQEKLTLTHGRRRKKVAIGIHDAAKVKAPFEYKAVAPDAVKFVPLGWTREATPAQILSQHEKGKEYAFALADKKRCPIIFDALGVVSFPPVINAARTTVTEKTTGLFLDVTGTDYDACNAALNILCQNFQDDGAGIESITVGGKETPETAPETMLLSIDNANKTLGTSFTAPEMARYLARQRITAVEAGKGVLRCSIPRYRADFLHEADLIEEVALGYGYNSFAPKKPSVFTLGSLSPKTLFEERARDLLVGAGYTELMTYVLSSEEKAFKSLVAEKNLVRIKNPVSKEYSALRSTLMPSLLEVLSENTHSPYPQRVFEAGEVVEKDSSRDTKSAERTHLCALSAHADASLSESASVLRKTCVALFGKAPVFESGEARQFMKGRQARVMLGGRMIGVVGELHPQVLLNWGITVPCAGFEVRLF